MKRFSNEMNESLNPFIKEFTTNIEDKLSDVGDYYFMGIEKIAKQLLKSIIDTDDDYIVVTSLEIDSLGKTITFNKYGKTVTNIKLKDDTLVLYNTLLRMASSYHKILWNKPLMINYNK